MSATNRTIVFPLFRQPDLAGMTEGEVLAYRREQREIIRRERENPGVQGMFNLVERVAARLQAAGVEPGAGAHEQGQAFGAGYLYEVLRGVLEGSEEGEG
jgi:hypothetical protein